MYENIPEVVKFVPSKKNVKVKKLLQQLIYIINMADRSFWMFGFLLKFLKILI